MFFASCSSSKASLSAYDSDIRRSREDKLSCFVQMNDGTIREFKALKLVTGVMLRPHLLADGKEKIYADQIKAYQNDGHYAVSQTTFCCGRMSAVASETLPGFAIRIVKGKLNVYRKKYLNGEHAIDEYFVQAGDEGKIMAYSPPVMEELLKDNAEASLFFKSLKESRNVRDKLIAAVYLYNSDQTLSKK
jgi:hypothetical protein